MTDELLPYYNRELAFIRESVGDFAARHPKIAGRLRLSQDAVEDPHVSRLIEAFAFQNARIRQKLDDDFPELTQSMLGILYPHYLAPIPALAITQLVPMPDISDKHVIPAQTSIESEPIQGEPCRFRTCYPVELWPIEVTDARYTSHTRGAPATPRSREARALLRLSLKSIAGAQPISALQPDRLRVYLKGQPQHVYPLYELLLNNVLEVAATFPNGELGTLGPECVQPVGFGVSEGLLPYPRQSSVGYRLLTEFFVFPEKFLFVEFSGLSQLAARSGETLELIVYLDGTASELDHNVRADTFVLGCTPVVNLFRQSVEPFTLDHYRTEHHLIPDARRPLAHEIYSIDRVTGTSPTGTAAEYRPFFGHRDGAADEDTVLWCVARRASNSDDPGTEIYLSLVDPEFSPAEALDWVVHVESTCLNRDLPSRLPFGGGQPRLQLSEATAPVAKIICLTPPTRTIRPDLGRGALWRLISHLTLNHLSLSNDAEGAGSLREILHLYNFNGSAESRNMIDSIQSLSSRRVAGRVMSGGHSGLAAGIEITVEFDPQRFAGSSLFLFASVLDRFMALYGSMNSFTRFVARIKGKEGVLHKWPARVGERTLL
ncbi:MAG: type VI secretion system baseplate subunit TssF [Gammaproteobacteria bacterium]|nr:type VI secretion system baseplate subunit TssF [Gammaproteobacteria bacterium]